MVVFDGVYFAAGKVSTSALMHLSAWLPTVIVVVVVTFILFIMVRVGDVGSVLFARIRNS